MLTLGDSNKSFKLDGDLLETMSKYAFNVSLSNPKDQKLIFEFGKEMKFNNKRKERKRDRDIPLIKFLSTNPDELCDRLKLLQQEKQAGTILT